MGEKMKPVADRISHFGSCTEIIYKCPNCHTSFAILGEKEHFCHNCGTEIDWNVYMTLKEPLKNADREKEMIEYVNKENRRIERD